MANNPLFPPLCRIFDQTGAPLAGGLVYTYVAGTSTQTPTYTDATGTTPNTNPVVLDATGAAQIWSNGSTIYKINVTDLNGVQQDGYPIDQYNPNTGATGAAGTFQMATAGGTADAITATYTPPLTLSNLTTCGFVATAPNATATPTFSPNSLLAHVITKKGGQPLSPGDIPAALAVCILEYNSANTRWELLNPATNMQNWAVASGGTADAITVTYAPAVTTLYDGLLVNFRAAAANATTTPTFSPNSLTAEVITKSGGAPLVAGNIAGNFAEYILRYNLANTRWELLNPSVVVPTASVAALTVLTSSATWTSPSDTTSTTVFKFTEIGCGGGGAGNNSAAGSSGAGGAGATCILYKSGLAASTGYVYTQGSQGTGGASGANDGTAGGNSTFIVGGTTMTANGGSQGLHSGAGGAGGTATGGGINITGQTGGSGFSANVNIAGGTGGSTAYGGGGVSLLAADATAGTGYGSGGGGGGNNGSHAGGNGAVGLLIIERVSG